ncbi:MAG: Crp/Fnr family transcriptional regulator [Janthinobacterium lividum]
MTGNTEQRQDDTHRFLLGRHRADLTPEMRDALAAAMSPRMVVPARKTIIRRGEEVRHSTLLVSGFLCRYMDARDGYRQLVSVQVPGDFVDLHGYPLHRLDHDVASLTEVSIITVSHDDLTALIERFPGLSRILWFATMLDAAMHREWIFRLGRLEAVGRVAHFLCETYERLRAVGLAADGRFDFPLTQQDIGEACGLTSVHVNRTLRRLREGGLAEMSAREVRIGNLHALAALGEFEPDYLYFDGGGPLKA